MDLVALSSRSLQAANSHPSADDKAAAAAHGAAYGVGYDRMGYNVPPSPRAAADHLHGHHHQMAATPGRAPTQLNFDQWHETGHGSRRPRDTGLQFDPVSEFGSTHSSPLRLSPRHNLGSQYGALGAPLPSSPPARPLFSLMPEQLSPKFELVRQRQSQAEAEARQPAEAAFRMHEHLHLGGGVNDATAMAGSRLPLPQGALHHHLASLGMRLSPLHPEGLPGSSSGLFFSGTSCDDGDGPPEEPGRDGAAAGLSPKENPVGTVEADKPVEPAGPVPHPGPEGASGSASDSAAHTPPAFMAGSDGGGTGGERDGDGRRVARSSPMDQPVELPAVATGAVREDAVSPAEAAEAGVETEYGSFIDDKSRGCVPVMRSTRTQTTRLEGVDQATQTAGSPLSTSAWVSMKSPLKRRKALDLIQKAAARRRASCAAAGARSAELVAAAARNGSFLADVGNSGSGSGTGCLERATALGACAVPAATPLAMPCFSAFT